MLKFRVTGIIKVIEAQNWEISGTQGKFKFDD